MFGHSTAIYIILAAMLLAIDIHCRLLVRPTGIVCKPLDEQFLKFQICEMKAVQREIVEINIRVLLFQKPVNNVTVQFNIKKRGYEHKGGLFQFTIDACAFLRNKKRNPLAELTYSILGFSKYSNLNHTCPYDHDVVFDRYRFNDSYIPMLPIAPGRYTMLSTWLVYNIKRASVIISFDFYER